MSAEVKPYQSQENKKEQIEQMFDNIAPSYDLLNSVLSLGIHKSWRRKAIKEFEGKQLDHLLDLATGTADFAIDAFNKLKPKRITGLDISKQMLAVGRKKLTKKGLDKQITLEYGDCENLPYSDGQFDGATVAFGVRNFENLQKGLQEIHRVLQKDSQFVVLEFTKPKNFLFKAGFNIYFKYMLPVLGWWKSRDPKAYKYLYESVQAFPDYDLFIKELKKSGFKECSWKALSFGICAIYTARKA